MYVWKFLIYVKSYMYMWRSICDESWASMSGCMFADYVWKSPGIHISSPCIQKVLKWQLSTFYPQGDDMVIYLSIYIQVLTSIIMYVRIQYEDIIWG